MEITVTLNHGFLNAEFTAEDREELEEDLIGFIEFLQENEDEFDDIELLGNPMISDGKPSLAAEPQNVESQTEERKVKTEGEPTTLDDHPLNPVAQKTGVGVGKLDEIVYADSDGEEMPQLLINKNELGGSKAERQRHASYLLLLVWEDCYGENRMKNSELKTLLSMASISDNNVHNMWKGAGKGMFDTTGRGSSATITLTGPGKREALKFIKKLVETDG